MNILSDKTTLFQTQARFFWRGG